MPRDSALIYPAKPLAPLLQAATVLLLRDSAQGLQVLMTRRSLTASFAPGAYVFPGGGIEPDDEKYARSASHLIGLRANPTEQHTIWALAAIRESFEELGVLLARQRGGASTGHWVTQAQINTLDRQANFYAQMQAQDFELAADEVFLLAHWITDRDMPKRFEVPFLVARMPEGQTPVADEKEQFAPEWVSPQDALDRFKAGQFFMIFPTVRTLERLASYATVHQALQACASGQPLWTSCPRAGLVHGREKRLMEHEAAYAELAMVSPYGQIAHELSWQHEKPVALLRHVIRLTAENPSTMTGPGTNTYIIGTPEKGYLVIDPGPEIASHIERILQATQGDIVAIICTHSHADHSPAAKPLQSRVLQAHPHVAKGWSQESARSICPILGLPSAATAKDSAWFEPDIVLKNHAQLAPYFRRSGGEKPFEISLHVVYTPGHAANHLCLILPEDGLLFSGDHVLNGSTTVIDPPDGNMSDYLDSLDQLATLCEQHDLRFILPAHGHVLSFCDARQQQSAQHDSKGGAARAISALKAHRLKREANIIAAMKQCPEASVEELVALAYSDVDAKLWPIAVRSLTAHVQRIRDLKLLEGRRQ
jgi:recombination protein RecT